MRTTETTPSQTELQTAQRMKALEKATATRRALKLMREELKAGRIDAWELLRGEADSRWEQLAVTMEIGKLLKATLGLPDTAFYDSKGTLVFTKQGPYTDQAALAADIRHYALQG